MEKRNYRESLEKDRQEITTDSSPNVSRRAQRQSGSQKPQKRRSFLLPALFFIFILIPVTILIYVAFIFEPDDTLVGAKNENEVSVETTAPPKETAVLIPEEAEEEPAEEEEKVEESPAAEQDDNSEESTEKEVADQASVEPEPPAETETPPAPAAPPVAEAPPVTVPPVAEVPEPAPVEPPESDSSASKTVVVKENETLYRIAVNNYGASGAGAAVEKIKQANGLGSNEIYVGQKLILP